MKKNLFVIILLFFGISQLSAQIETYKGKLRKKTWTKSIESYCAGGSDYFVLETLDNQNIILDVSAWSQRQIAKYLQKDIEIKGTWRTETKDESQSDPLSQHPTTPTMCRIFVVKK